MNEDNEVKKILYFAKMILEQKEFVHALLDAFEAKDLAEGKIIIKSSLINDKLKMAILPKLKDIEDFYVEFWDGKMTLVIKVNMYNRVISMKYDLEIANYVFSKSGHILNFNYSEIVNNINGIGGGLLAKVSSGLKKTTGKNALQLLKMPTGIEIYRDILTIDLDQVEIIQELIDRQPYLRILYEQVELDSIRIMNNGLLLSLIHEEDKKEH